MKTPSRSSNSRMASTISWMFSIWAKTLVAVMIFAGPQALRTCEALSRVKKACVLGMPDWIANWALSVGSMPCTRWPACFHLLSSVPSFEPISTTSPPAPGSMTCGFAMVDHFREVLVQDPRRAAGVRIIRRKEHCGIDDAAQLNQLAMGTEEQFRRIGGLLARPLADRTHLVDRGNIADEEDRLEILAVAQLAFLDDQAGPGAGGKR